MSMLPFESLPAAVEAVLRAALPRKITVTQDPNFPTMDQCPLVQVLLNSSAHSPLQMVGYGPGQDDVTFRVMVACWQFSGESGQDAARQRNTLVSMVHDALRENPTMLGVVASALITAVDFGWEQGDQGGLFGRGVLTLTCRTLG